MASDRKVVGCGFESHGGHVFSFTLISYVPGAMLPLLVAWHQIV